MNVNQHLSKKIKFVMHNCMRYLFLIFKDTALRHYGTRTVVRLEQVLDIQ